MTFYHQQLQELYRSSLYGIKLGLNNSLRLHAALGYPANDFKTIHVAGTNGKGSTATKIAKGLEASGLRVGLYTSPHIATFRERISINGTLISEEDVARLLNQIFSICNHMAISATFFEITTHLCFKYFQEQNLDIAVIEVGLGGRLDATNIIHPVLSVITSISLDHTEILGNTIHDITLEKAGIIKPKTPVVIGPRVSFSLIEPIAYSNESIYHQVIGSFNHFEEENQAIAKRAMEVLNVPKEALVHGLQYKPKCRLEEYYFGNQKVVFDVAHNPDGLEQLFKALKQKFPNDRFRVIAAFSMNKDLKACLSILESQADAIHLTQVDHPRSALIEHLSQLIPISHQFSFHPDLNFTINAALEKAQLNKEILVICGTFFIMHPIRQILGIREASDLLLLTDFSSQKKM